MTHLDRSHHHDLDQTQKQNLILSRDHDRIQHFDWDDLSHTPDVHPFFHETLHSQQPLSPHNIHLTPDTTTSPAHPTHDPLDDKSSSLSPAPDSGSPVPQQNSVHLSHPPAQDKQDPDLAVEGTLTPLTDLSPAPDLDDPPEENKGVPDDTKISSSLAASSTSQDDPSRDRRVQPTVRINGTSSPPTSSASSPSRQFSFTDVFSARRNGTPAAAGSSHSRASSGEFLVPPLPSGLSSPTAGQSGSDSKVVRILEINAELFKVCSEFQLRGIPVSDSRFQQYALRLQVNLTWLAAAADQRHNSPNITLPFMGPPVAVEFASMDRIHNLYADMPSIFAKDVARRQLLNAIHQGSPTIPSAAPNGALKRTRPDDLSDIASKRRDMGENKPQVTVTQAPPPVMSLPSATSQPNPPSTFPPPSQPTIAMSTAQAMPQSPRVSSPAMPPPSSTPSLPFAVTEASIAASTRARTRELHIQQVREQQLRQAPQMQQMQGGRHMSPTSTSQQQQVPQGVAGGQSNTAFGAQAQHPSSILQSPSHPLMQYMIQQIPQFTSLPPQQQMQLFQNFIAQRQQQQRQLSQVATPPRNPQMAGMAPNASMPSMSNGSLSAGSIPSPVSPLGQQSPVVSQQQVMNMPAQNGMFSFPQGHANTGMDPRMAGSNFSSQLQGGIPNNMNVNQQRQLMLMQQQMRNTNGNMNAVPNMMNSQQYAYVMAQRMAQAGPSQPNSGVGGSPMSAPTGDQFPALRSNSTIPGIARSARSPSDGLHSPMTPRAPSRLSQQSQLQQNDYSQAMMQQAHAAMAPNPVAFNPQVQNPSWPQSGQQPMQQQMGMVAGQMNGYSMNSPNSVGGGGYFGSTPSPSNPNWQQHQQGMTGSYPYGQSTVQHTPSDQGRLSHMTGMSIPQNMSPMVNGSAAPGEYDLFNYSS